MYRILALDGGGIRGLFTARLLQRLDEAVPDFLSSIDLFAGTSTGGILALALASGMSPETLVTWYQNKAKLIFPKSIWSDFAQSAEPKYNGRGLNDALLNAFGTGRLCDLRRQVLITSYDCELRLPTTMTSRDTLTIVQAARRTSAAPVYFPPAEGRYIDGGVAANNPSLVALAHASEYTDPRFVRVLSCGTGNRLRPPFTPGEWGAVEWLQHGLLDLMFDAPSDSVDCSMSDLLADRFFRLDGSVDCAMDESEGLVDKLIKPADALDLKRVVAWARN